MPENNFLTEDILLSQQGDGEAYRRVIEEYTPHVAKMMWRFTRDRLEHADLIQDVFVEIWMALPNYRPIAPFQNWLSRIATRTGYNYWHRKKRTNCENNVNAEFLNLIADPESEKAFEKISSEDGGKMAFDLLSKLPPRDRLVLTLRFVEENSVEETAVLAGWTQVMVKVQTWRARKKLKKIVEQLKKEKKI